MNLAGLHHITMITGDAQRNVAFYADLLGLRLVKKTVNFDAPEAYHLYFGDERGTPGTILTWFEFAGARRGRPGLGMIHTLQLGVAAEQSLDFWAARLSAAGYESERSDGRLRFADYDGLALELVLSDQPPLRAEHPEIPAEHALQGFDGVRVYAGEPEDSRRTLEQVLGFVPAGDEAWEARGPSRGGLYAYDQPPASSGVPGAGTVHHVAWASSMEEHEDWHARVTEAGLRPTPIIDRFWFRSIYFREPSGVLFEIATLGPGFAVDEDPEHLGERLVLPPAFEHLRPQIEPVLTPLEVPATARR
jgi:glyoxalase family protein